MKVLLDTNIVLDFLLQREPFCQDAELIIGYITATTLTDIFYITGQPLMVEVILHLDNVPMATDGNFSGFPVKVPQKLIPIGDVLRLGHHLIFEGFEHPRLTLAVFDQVGDAKTALFELLFDGVAAKNFRTRLPNHYDRRRDYLPSLQQLPSGNPLFQGRRSPYKYLLRPVVLTIWTIVRLRG
jgi:hypothetical protein